MKACGIRFWYETETLPATRGHYEWQRFVRTRLVGRVVNVATVGKVRGAERYTILPALQFSETIGHGHTLDSMEAVICHLRQAVKDYLA